MKSSSFNTLAGWFAILAGVFGLLYAIAFVLITRSRPELGVLLSALFLLIGGFCGFIALTGLFQHLREVEPSYALLGFMLAVGAAAGSLIHGGYDLSNALHPPATLNTDLPSPIDPRGLLTFGVASVGLFIFSWLMSRSSDFPKGLAYLGYLSAFLMIVLYLGRLIILDPSSRLILLPAALEGFLVNPIWYIWLGVKLLSAK